MTDMRHSMLKVAVATAVFGLIHSALASRSAKRAAADIMGNRNRDGLYRLLYNGQAVVCCVLLVAYIRQQPSRELYRIRGPLAYAMHAGQAAAVLYAAAAIYQIGAFRISGVESFLAWIAGGPVNPPPEGQGPALDAEGLSRPACPFAWSRHPLNFVPVPLLWLWPRMTTNLLAFNTVTTAYLILGSWHEEQRLLEAYGDRFVDYRESGVPFYLPALQQGAMQPMRRKLQDVERPSASPRPV